MAFVILVGFPGSGKSTVAEQYAASGYVVLSRDHLQGAKASYKDVADAVRACSASAGIVIDNTNLTVAQRRLFVDVARELGRDEIVFHHVATDFERCFINVLRRQYRLLGHACVHPEPPRRHDDPHIFPPAVLYKARKDFEPPTAAEGGRLVVTRSDYDFDPAVYTNRALFLDIDGTLRETEHLPNKYPTDPSEVMLVADGQRMRDKLRRYLDDGYLLIGVSNQSGVAKGTVTEAQVVACMDRTRELLGLTATQLPIYFCPHRSAPISCYCRKPGVGFAVEACERFKIDPRRSTMVGDRTTDKTFAARMGMAYVDAKAFWA